MRGLIQELIQGLNFAETEKLKREGCTNVCFFNGEIHQNNLTSEHRWHFKKGLKRFSKIDCGTSGAFMVENETGEIYNIKAYGVPDKNKKIKADLGKIQDYFFSDLGLIDIKKVCFLHSKRWNYLR